MSRARTTPKPARAHDDYDDVPADNGKAPAVAELSVCSGCGVAYDFAAVQARPFKVCPVCHKPLDTDAAAHTYSETSQHAAQLKADTNGRLSPVAQDAANAVAESGAEADD